MERDGGGQDCERAEQLREKEDVGENAEGRWNAETIDGDAAITAIVRAASDEGERTEIGRAHV